MTERKKTQEKNKNFLTHQQQAVFFLGRMKEVRGKSLKLVLEEVV